MSRRDGLWYKIAAGGTQTCKGRWVFATTQQRSAWFQQGSNEGFLLANFCIRLSPCSNLSKMTTKCERSPYQAQHLNSEQYFQEDALNIQGACVCLSHSCL